MTVDINCDMGESFGLYSFGNDAAIMPYITQANVACGFHGSDPNHMERTVNLARKHGVKVGAHVSLPDLQGFGRREMKVDRDELRNIILYQIGALSAFLKKADMELNHIKPHGALYGMAAREEHIAQAVADAAELFDVKVMGLSSTLHEEIYTRRGIGFLPEFFADLEYSDEGSLLITREHRAVDPDVAACRAVQATQQGTVTSVNGITFPIRVETICVHSDTPNAVAVAAGVRDALIKLETASIE